MSDTFLKPIDFVEVAATPSNPPAGYRRIYSKSDGFTYQLTSAGVETRLDNVASGGSLLVQDEGSTLTSAATSLNFTGGGVTATNSGGDVTINVPVNQNAFSAVTGNTGTATADTPSDSVAITGSNGITTTATDTPDGLVISPTFAAPGSIQPDDAASAGAANSFARSDHVHAIVTVAPSTIGTANSEGVASSFVRSDHVHAHGSQTDASLHAVATTGANGFMSSTDKTKLDGVASGAQVNQNAFSSVTGNTGTATADVVSDSVAITGNIGITTTATDTPDGLVISPTYGSPVALGATASDGANNTFARSDHVHLNPVIAHEAAGDPHPQYATTAEVTAALPNAFNTFAVSGQTNVVADTTTDTLTLVAGTNITITTDPATDSITINGTAGGGGTPAGADTNIQFNNAGAFGGEADLSWNQTTNTLLLTGANPGIQLTGIVTEPSPPPVDTGRLYAKNIAGRMMPKWVGPSGFDYPLQSTLAQNNITAWRGGNTAVATTFASVLGTMPYTGASPVAPTIPTLAATNLKTQITRSVISTSTTAGTLAYIRGNAFRMWRGNAAGLGGYYVVHRLSLTTLVANMRVFAGVQDTVANPTNIDPTTSTTPGRIGLAINANSGNWNLVHNVTGTAPTVIALGANFPVNNTNVMELILFCAPNGAGVGYRVTNLTSNLSVSGTISTNQPANTAFLIPTVWVTNNATAAACAIDFISTYVETDF